MGSLYDYKCPDCGFTARCSHGHDRGFRVAVESLFCSKCKILKNVTVGLYSNDGYKSEIPICKTCQQSESLSRWDGTTCPICSHVPMLYRDTYIAWD